MLDQNDFDWNDLKALLALAGEGSALAAARRLGVNQTTIARRLDALERALGVRLVERRAAGYVLTPRGAEAAALAGPMAEAAAGLGSAAAAWQRGVAGNVRVSATETLAVHVLAGLAARLRESHPAIALELAAEDRRADLRRGEADLAIRITAPGVPAETAPGLLGRRIGASRWGLYCAAAYAARHGLPARAEDLSAHACITGSGTLAGLPALAWLATLVPEGMSVAMRCNSVPNLIAAVRAGLGIAPLPCLAAAGDPGLRRLLPEACLDAPVWLLWRESDRDDPALRAVIGAVVARFGEMRGALTGTD